LLKIAHFGAVLPRHRGKFAANICGIIGGARSFYQPSHASPIRAAGQLVQFLARHFSTGFQNPKKLSGGPAIQS
jgi:hypothetical protein